MSGMLDSIAGPARAQMAKSMQETLVRLDKVATRQTYASIDVDAVASPLGDLSLLGSAASGWRFVEAGKRAGTKLPMVKTADGWRLVERLAAWKKARALTMPDFLLARKIARDPRAPVALSMPAMHDAYPVLVPLIFNAMAQYVASGLNAIATRPDKE